MPQLCKVEYRIRADLSKRFESVRRDGHVRSDLIHGVLTSAVRAYRNGAQLPRPSRRIPPGTGTDDWRFTCPADEREALGAALREAGSSGRAVLEAFAQAYVDAGGDLLAVELPWEQAREELSKAS